MKTCGEELLSRALKTRLPSGEESDTFSAKMKRRTVPLMDTRSGIASFGEALRERDLARIELGRDRLVFEREKS